MWKFFIKEIIVILFAKSEGYKIEKYIVVFNAWELLQQISKYLIDTTLKPL